MRFESRILSRFFIGKTVPSKRIFTMTLILNEDQANMVVKNFTPEAKQLYVKKISHQQINVPIGKWSFTDAKQVN